VLLLEPLHILGDVGNDGHELLVVDVLRVRHHKAAAAAIGLPALGVLGREAVGDDGAIFLREVELALDVLADCIAPLEVLVAELLRVLLGHLLAEVCASDIRTIGHVIVLTVARHGVLALRLIKGEQQDPLVLAADALEVLANVDAVALLKKKKRYEVIAYPVSRNVRKR